MEKSYVCADDIKESQYSVPRPLRIPQVIVSYMGELVVGLAKTKIADILERSRIDPKCTASVPNQT